MPNSIDNTTLEMALIGYESERQKIREKIAELQRQLNGRTPRAVTPVAAPPGPRTRRRMSAAARKRIAAAQKKRWAEYRKKHKAASSL
jgi:hypothetical protein